MSSFDKFTPCDDSYELVNHPPHSYTWAGQEYECRGYPPRVAVFRSGDGKLLSHVYGGADMDSALDPPYQHRFVPAPTVKRGLHHRLMDWLMTLTTLQCYILAAAAVFVAATLFFTVIWSWIMFG